MDTDESNNLADIYSLRLLFPSPIAAVVTVLRLTGNCGITSSLRNIEELSLY